MHPIAGMSEEARRLALVRFHALQPHLDEHRPLSLVAEEARIPFRTAQRWVARFRRSGLAALARKERADTGHRRVLSKRLREAIEGLALEKPPLPIAALHRRVRELARGLGERPPSYWTVYRVVGELPADLLTLAHEGSKAYGQAFELVHRREASGSNAVWQADHTPLDLLVLRPDKPPAKPWLTIVIDDYSRAIAGYFLSFEAPSALHTSLALRQAIWRKEDPRWAVCGIPEVLYTDHGSDFTSQHLEQVSADLRIRLVFSLPGKPRGRGRIERFFSTLNEMLLCELPGYAPPGGATRGRPTLTLPELDTRLRSFVLDVYHRRSSSTTSVPPAERWEAGGFLPRMPESQEQLDLLLVHVAKTRQVRRDGIHFEGLRYTATTLAAYVGATVTIRFDPRDLAEIRTFHEGRFLCRAVCPELAGASPSLRDLVRARNQRRRDLRGILRNRRETVAALLGIKNGESVEGKDVSPTPPEEPPAKRDGPGLKRYRNE